MLDDFRPAPGRGDTTDKDDPITNEDPEQGRQAAEHHTHDDEPPKSESHMSTSAKKHAGIKLPKHLAKLTKKQWIIIGVVVVLVAGGAGFWWAKSHAKKPVPVAAPKTQASAPAVVQAPAPIVSRLTGVPVSEELSKRPVTAIMIENSPDARPQSGLNQAGIVFEAVAEGGITRFLTLFEESQPDYIGPVRSVRPYYLDWLMPFDAAVAHAGGSGQALAEIKSFKVKDLDHGANGSAYQRISSRYAPHNLYTSMAKLDAASQKRGYTTSTFTSFVRKAEAPSTTPSVRSIDFTMSSFFYNPHYDYDQATNTYKRSEGGKPHVDERSKAQLSPKTVVALVIPRSQNGIYSVYQTVGSGPMFVFQDGILVQGTWTKASRGAQYTFSDTAGKPLALNAGQTWFTAVANSGAVAYK